MPDVAESSLFPTQSLGVGRSKFLTPVSDRFVGDKDSSVKCLLVCSRVPDSQPSDHSRKTMLADFLNHHGDHIFIVEPLVIDMDVGTVIIMSRLPFD